MLEARYRINDRWAIGLSLGYANSKNSVWVSGMESELKLTHITLIHAHVIPWQNWIKLVCLLMEVRVYTPRHQRVI